MDHTERIIKQLEKLDERLQSIDKTLVKQEANLAEHMRRTAILESRLDKSDGKLNRIITLLILGAGASSVYYWPIVSTFLKVII